MAPAKDSVKRSERLLTFVILCSLVLGWVAGLFRHHSSIGDILIKSLPEAVRFDSGQDDIFSGYSDAEPESDLVGYTAIRSAHGYAGPVKVAVGLDKNGTIANAVIVRQTESAAFFSLVTDNGYPSRFKGKNYSDQFEVGNDVDSVTGATVSLKAVSNAVQQACSDVAVERLSLPAVSKDKTSIQFGISEVILTALIITGLWASGNNLPAKKYIKWGVMVGSIIFIGFVFKKPASLIHLNSLLVGYLPGWQNHIYWYLLVAVILLPVIINGKTPYCSSICPFGATQEILVSIGGTRRQMPGKWLRLFKILQRSLAWIAVMCAIIFRNPAIVTYDVSATFFTVIGQNWKFVLLALVLIMSLFVVRPWCNCLCPLRAVFDFIRLLRRATKIMNQA